MDLASATLFVFLAVAHAEEQAYVRYYDCREDLLAPIPPGNRRAVPTVDMELIDSCDRVIRITLSEDHDKRAVLVRALVGDLERIAPMASRAGWTEVSAACPDFWALEPTSLSSASRAELTKALAALEGIHVPGRPEPVIRLHSPLYKIRIYGPYDSIAVVFSEDRNTPPEEAVHPLTPWVHRILTALDVECDLAQSQ